MNGCKRLKGEQRLRVPYVLVAICQAHGLDGLFEILEGASQEEITYQRRRKGGRLLAVGWLR